MRVLINNDRNINLREDLVKYIGKEGRLHHKLTTKHGASVSVVEFDDGGCICWLSHMAIPMSKIDGEGVNNNIDAYGDNKVFIAQSSVDKLKGSDMKEDNRHPHHDLIVEWLVDMSKELQVKSGSETMCNVDVSKVISDKKGGYEFRIKPREFIKGHWYPCLRDDGAVIVRMFDGLGMSLGVDVGLSVNPLQFKDIGKSLGVAEFK